MPTKQSPAPEKKWEESFEAQFGDLAESEYLAYKQLPDFIRQILEEKAVEVERLKEPNHPKDFSERTDARNEVLSEAAAILRR